MNVTKRDSPSQRKLIGIGVLTYNRPSYLKRFLEALANQETTSEFDLVILDNGSTEPIADSCGDFVSRLNASVRIVREETNHLGVERYQELIDALDSDYVFLPGDDDVPMPNFVSTAHGLALAHPESVLLSTSMGQVNANGQRLAALNRPPRHEDAPQAIAHLLSAPGYTMPSTAFRKDLVNLCGAPRTRTTIDWWLWLQAWCSGPAVVSDTMTILYRQHPGQEQRMYGGAAFRNDAGRMLVRFVESPSFSMLLDTWSTSDVEKFTTALMSSQGPNYGDSRWGPLVQMVLADRLVDFGWRHNAVQLLAQAAGHAGTPASLGILQALGQELTLTSYPRSAWSRVPAAIVCRTECARTRSWLNYLNLSSHSQPQFHIEIWCSCGENDERDHTLSIEAKRFDGTAGVHFHLKHWPNEAEAGMLMEELGVLTGRLHGFELGAGLEQRLAQRLQTFRLTPLGVIAEHGYRLLRRVSAWCDRSAKKSA